MTPIDPLRGSDGRAKQGLSRSVRCGMEPHFEDFFGEGESFGGSPWPAVEILDTKESLLVRAEIPGVDPKEIQVSVSEDILCCVLTIRGEKKPETLREEGNHYLEERAYGPFRRTFRMPAWVDLEHIEAGFRNGVLELTIRKRADAKLRSVKVKTA